MCRDCDKRLEEEVQTSSSVTPEIPDLTKQKIQLLKDLMEQIDTSISEYKEQIHLTYEELNNEEKLLSKEIEISEKKIVAWQTVNQTSESIQKDSKKKLAESNDENNSNLLKEVIDFDVSWSK